MLKEPKQKRAKPSPSKAVRAILEDNQDEEGVPSKAIWDPSLSVSSASSVTSSVSTSTASITSGNYGVEDVEMDLAAHSTQATTEPKQNSASAAAPPTENELRMRIYEGTTRKSNRGGKRERKQEDDNRLSSMLTNSISTAHGPGSRSGDNMSITSEEKNNNVFSTNYDERYRFVRSMAHLNDKQLRIQLWDGFRLARVILGKPIKDKRKLSHKSILHAIRKVAEMKIQIIRMSEELDDFRQKKKKDKKRKLKLKMESPEKMIVENVQDVEREQEAKQEPEMEQEQGVGSPLGKEIVQTPKSEGSNTSSLSSSRESSGSERSMLPSVRSVITDSKTPAENVKNLRQKAIEILEKESALALYQIQEIDERQHKKRRRSESDIGAVPPTPTSTGSASLFLSPSSSGSSESDDFSFNDYETASDILHAFHRENSPAQKERDLPITSDSPRRYGAAVDDHADEIRRVLRLVVALKNERKKKESEDEPEITTIGETTGTASSVSAVHEDVISLLTRLTSNPSPTKESVKETQTEAQPLSPGLPPKSTEVEAQRNLHTVYVQDVEENVNVKEDFEDTVHMKVSEDSSNEEMTDEMKEETEDEIEEEMEDDEIAECRFRLSAAKMQEAESIENFKHLSLQKEMVLEDIVIAKKNTTANRSELQLLRLKGYKNQLNMLLKREKERAKQIGDLDTELNQLAMVCVTLEDAESEFRAKNELHQNALSEFWEVTNNHTKRFRELMQSINRGIKEQTTIVFGDKESDDSGSDSQLSKGSGSFEESYSSDDSSSDSAKKIQRLELLLTKQNIELFKIKAKLKKKEQKEQKAKKIPHRIKW